MRRYVGRRRGAAPQRGMTLVELLIGMIIMTVLSTMILMGWFSLSRSYSFSLASSDARDSARQAMSRMEREVRDVENNQAVSETSIVHARASWIEFYTTFNMAGASSASTVPRLVLYRLYSNGELWRFQDKDGIGGIANVSLNDSGWDEPYEQLHGEGAMLLADHVINDSIPYTDPYLDPITHTHASYPSTPLFQYQVYDASGNMIQTPSVTGASNRAGIMAVQIHLLVDLNPSRKPVYADFQATAQLRNNR